TQDQEHDWDEGGLEDLLQQLDGVEQSGDGWKARCPAHEDRNPSLSINWGDGRILLHCFAGCDTEAILDELGLDWGALHPDDSGGRERRPGPRRPTELSEDEADLRDQVYRDLLGRLELSAEHQEHLRAQRGLSDQAIDRAGYRTLDGQSASRAFSLWSCYRE